MIDTEEKTELRMLYCSFCGKSQHEVRKLIAGPTVIICDECTKLCVDILEDRNYKEDYETPMEAVTTIYKWVERGIYNNKWKAEAALKFMAYHPAAPWAHGEWDVNHKEYAARFYADFPDSMPKTETAQPQNDE